MDIFHLILNSQRITAVGDYHLDCVRNKKKKKEETETQIPQFE